jgi:hypothetical protein
MNRVMSGFLLDHRGLGEQGPRHEWDACENVGLTRRQWPVDCQGVSEGCRPLL